MREPADNSNNGGPPCVGCTAEFTEFIESPSAKCALVAPLLQSAKTHSIYAPDNWPTSTSATVLLVCGGTFNGHVGCASTKLHRRIPAWRANYSVFSPSSVPV